MLCPVPLVMGKDMASSPLKVTGSCFEELFHRPMETLAPRHSIAQWTTADLGLALPITPTASTLRVCTQTGNASGRLAVHHCWAVGPRAAGHSGCDCRHLGGATVLEGLGKFWDYRKSRGGWVCGRQRQGLSHGVRWHTFWMALGGGTGTIGRIYEDANFCLLVFYFAKLFWR